MDKEDTDKLVEELEEEKNLPDLALIAAEIAQVTKQISDAKKIKIWLLNNLLIRKSQSLNVNSIDFLLYSCIFLFAISKM